MATFSIKKFIHINIYRMSAGGKDNPLDACFIKPLRQIPGPLNLLLCLPRLWQAGNLCGLS